MRSTALLLPVCLGVLLVPAVGDEPGRAAKIFEAALLRVAGMNAERLGVFFTPTATDPLDWGIVEVRRKREVEVQLKGAPPSATYAGYFCRLGAMPSDCQLIGLLETDHRGDGEARRAFLLSGVAWSGVFVLTRNQANQLVSGFRFSSEAEETATVTLEIHGRIALLTANGFRLLGFPLEILVTPQTRFEKVSGLAGLKLGEEVDVWAYTRSEGVVVATRVRVDEGPDPPGRAIGNGR